MQRPLALLRLSRSLQVRHGSGGPVVYSRRWVEAIRAESNIDTPQDPPTADLSPDHEVNDGTSDFSNWVNRHEDVSLTQALSGFALMGAVVFGICQLAVRDRRKKDPDFVPRDCPTIEHDFPSMAIPHFSEKKHDVFVRRN